MPSKKNQRNSGNLNLAAFFIASLVFIIFFSLLVKIFIVYNQSKFNGDTPISVFVKEDKSYVISMVPDRKTLSVFSLNANEKEESSSVLGIPIDAYIYPQGFDKENGLKQEISKILVSFRGSETDLTLFDRIRLLLFVRSLGDESISLNNITSNSSSSEIDELVSREIYDSEIVNEARSIEVINASGIDGEGSKIARMASNMGGNVILVSTSSKILNYSSVEYKNESGYTAHRFSKAFGFDLKEHKGDSIADVIIVVGKDRGE